MTFKQKKYLSNTPLAEALHIYNEALKAANIGVPLPGERIAISDALGHGNGVRCRAVKEKDREG